MKPGSTVFSCSDETIAAVQQSEENDLSFTILPTGKEGVAQINITTTVVIDGEETQITDFVGFSCHDDNKKPGFALVAFGSPEVDEDEPSDKELVEAGVDLEEDDEEDVED